MYTRIKLMYTRGVRASHKDQGRYLRFTARVL